MTNVRSLKSKITIADQNTIEVEAMGDIQIECKNSHITLLNCMYCPSFAVNLISVSKLNSAGAKVSFEGDRVTVSYKNYPIMNGLESGSLFYLEYEKINNMKPNVETAVNIQTQSHQILAAKNQITEADYNLHSKLGHPSIKTMRQLGFHISNISKTKYCEECVLSKSTRNEFTDHLSRNKATKLLERLHMDLAFINQQYILGILDEYSRKPFIYILNSKSETSQKAIDLINFMENQTNHRVKSIHSDNGSEFVNCTISEFCKAKGIKQTTSVPYTPHLAERM